MSAPRPSLGPIEITLPTDELEIMRDNAEAVLVRTLRTGLRDDLLRDIIRIAEKYLPAERTPGIEHPGGHIEPFGTGQ